MLTDLQKQALMLMYEDGCKDYGASDLIMLGIHHTTPTGVGAILKSLVMSEYLDLSVLSGHKQSTRYKMTRKGKLAANREKSACCNAS